ncbi:hypothetical protein HpBT189_07090 [Helicobacter pylori]
MHHHSLYFKKVGFFEIDYSKEKEALFDLKGFIPLNIKTKTLSDFHSIVR